MSYRSRNHVFLYHAHALALGGWVRDKHSRFHPLPAIAPSVLSITGGYASACEKHVNYSTPASNLWIRDGQERAFHLYVGHAYSEVRGTVEDDVNPFGEYVTTVRSVLDDVRINDDLYVEHAEAILTSSHENPSNPAPEEEPYEPGVRVGKSNMFGVSVRGAKVTLAKHDEDHVIDEEPVYGRLSAAVHSFLLGGSPPDLPPGLCNWHKPSDLPANPPQYAVDLQRANAQAQNHFRFSLFEDVNLSGNGNDVRPFKSSIEVDNFGRIFFGEVIASHGMKQVQMFRIDLGCDNCGGVGGSGGTTNGGPMP